MARTPRRPRRPRRILSKKAKLAIGLGVPLGMAAIGVITIVSLYFASVADNNATNVSGSDKNDHQIIQELTEEEINNNKNSETGDIFKSDSDYENSTPSGETNSEEKIKNDDDFNTGTDSDEIIYKKIEQTAQNQNKIPPKNLDTNSYYNRVIKNQVRGVGGYNKNINKGGRYR